MKPNNHDQSSDLSRGHAADHDNIAKTSNLPEKRILVPLDGSELAEMALPHAVSLARTTSSGLVLMRVVPPITLMSPMGGLVDASAAVWEVYDEQPALSRQYLSEVVERLAATQLHMDAVETVVNEGNPAELIIQYAREHPEVTAIAMSTHGRSGLGRWVFGSVAEKVLHSSPVPLLLIRPESEQEAPDLTDIPVYKTILVPLDGSAFAEEALDQVQIFARAFHSRVVLLSVATTPFDLKLVKYDPAGDWSAMPWYTPAAYMAKYLDGIMRKLTDAGVTVQAEVTYGDIADEILKAARFMEADLIAMSTHGNGGLGHRMVGSVAMRVAQMSSTPLLLVHVKVDDRGKEKAETETATEREQPVGVG